MVGAKDFLGDDDDPEESEVICLVWSHTRGQSVDDQIEEDEVREERHNELTESQRAAHSNPASLNNRLSRSNDNNNNAQPLATVANRRRRP